MAEATLAFKAGLTVWAWNGSSFGSGTKGPNLPPDGANGNLYGNCNSLAAKGVPHVGA